jgi:hypothetical protein
VWLRELPAGRRDYLPHDPPLPGVVKYHFYRWRDDGTGEETRCE